MDLSVENTSEGGSWSGDGGSVDVIGVCYGSSGSSSSSRNSGGKWIGQN